MKRPSKKLDYAPLRESNSKAAQVALSGGHRGFSFSTKSDENPAGSSNATSPKASKPVDPCMVVMEDTEKAREDSRDTEKVEAPTMHYLKRYRRPSLLGGHSIVKKLHHFPMDLESKNTVFAKPRDPDKAEEAQVRAAARRVSRDLGVDGRLLDAMHDVYPERKVLLEQQCIWDDDGWLVGARYFFHNNLDKPITVTLKWMCTNDNVDFYRFDPHAAAELGRCSYQLPQEQEEAAARSGLPSSLAMTGPVGEVRHFFRSEAREKQFRRDKKFMARVHVEPGARNVFRLEPMRQNFMCFYLCRKEKIGGCRELGCAYRYGYKKFGQWHMAG